MVMFGTSCRRAREDEMSREVRSSDMAGEIAGDRRRDGVEARGAACLGQAISSSPTRVEVKQSGHIQLAWSGVLPSVITWRFNSIRLSSFCPTTSSINEGPCRPSVLQTSVGDSVKLL